MFQGPSSGCNYIELVEDLVCDVPNFQEIPNGVERDISEGLYVSLNVLGHNIASLVDSGSQITCISEKLYQFLNSKFKLNELPVNNVLILSAIGRKATPVKRQILLDIYLGTLAIRTVFLIIPHLTNDIILGNDWLSANKVILDYGLQMVCINGMSVDPQLFSYGRKSSEQLKSFEWKHRIYVEIIRVAEKENKQCNVVRERQDLFVEAMREQHDEMTCAGDGAMLDVNKSEYPRVRNESVFNGVEENNESKILLVEDKEMYPSNEIPCVKNRILNENDVDYSDSLGLIFDDNLVIMKRDINNVNNIELENVNDIEFDAMENIEYYDDEVSENVSCVNNVDVGDEECLDPFYSHSKEVVTTRSQDHNFYKDQEFEERINLYQCAEDHNFYEQLDSYKQIRRLDVEGADHNFFEDVRTIAINLTGVSDVQRNALQQLLYKYQSLFSDKAGCTSIYEHSIKLIQNKSYVRKSYPIPLKLRESVNREIEDMLKEGIIERSNSSYCNPLRIVSKKDGGVRLCLDARHLNDVIESDNEAPPPIEELLCKYDGVKYMSTTDLTHGYWQIPLDRQSRQYTAFLHGGTLYQFCRIPFGLKTAGSGFIRALNLALGNEFSSFLTCYVDDLLITSRDFNSHLAHLEAVFSRLSQHNFTIRLSKSLFFRTSVPFLGFILTPEGVRPNPDKLEVIKNFPVPSNKKQLQQFLGVCNYYRRFSVQYANEITPLKSLLQDKVPWVWTEEHDVAYQRLKEKFMNCVTLNHYLPKTIFKVQTDASDLGISGVLYQIDSEGNHRIISLVSRCLKKAELNYNTTEKELLAIVFAVTKFRIYLVGGKFELITDHRALTFLNSTYFQNARLMRWSLLLQQYDFEVKHCKGKDNVVADFFSRNIGEKQAKTESSKLSVPTLSKSLVDQLAVKINKTEKLMISLDPVLGRDLKRLEHLQRSDEEVNALLENCQDHSAGNTYKIHHNLLFYRGLQDENWRVVIPGCLVKTLVKSIHEKLGHMGSYKTFQYINSYFYWKKMREFIKKYTQSCDLCQRVKTLNYSMQGEYQRVMADRPNDLVTIDFYGPLPRSVGGVQYLLVAIDAFSKYVVLYPIKRATTLVALNKILNDYCINVGVPTRLLSDNGTQFTASKWKVELEKHNIQVCYSSVRHPQSNPTERVMRELGRCFRTLCSDQHTRWAKYVKEIEKVFNLTTHHSTGFIPYELHFNKRANDQLREIIKFPDTIQTDHDTKIMLARQMLEKSFQHRGKYQKSKSSVVLNVGDLVLLRVPFQSSTLNKVTHKFFHIYHGPYEIIKNIGGNAYQLVDVNNPSKIIGTYNRVSLRKYWQPM